MKKTKIKKITALALAAVMAAAFLTGCSIFEYNEDADMEQTILEINPIEYTYEVPVTVDYEDPDGNPVHAVDNDPDSASFGEETDEIVSAVLRDHDGDPIHIPAENDSGAMLYVGYELSDDGELDYTKPVEGGVTYGDDRMYEEEDGKNKDNHFIVYEKNSGAADIGRSYSAAEYEFDGLVYDTASVTYALWRNTEDGTTKAGDVAVNGAASATAKNAANYDDAFPVVVYTMTGSAPDYKRDTWTWTEAIHVAATASAETEYEAFYKQTLISYFNESGYELFSQNGYTIDECFDEFIEQLYTSYLTYAEAEMAVKGGYVEWGVPEINSVNQSIYDQIDTTLDQLSAEVADDFDIKYPSVEGGSTDEDTTYPTPPEEGATGDNAEDYVVWHITDEPSRCVGKSDNVTVNSLRRAAMRKFVDVISDYIDDSRAMSAEERETFENEVSEMREMITTPAGTDKLYISLYTYDIIWFMYGESQEHSVKTNGLRDYLVKDIQSSDRAAREAFEEELERQKREYRDDIQSYYTDATGDTTILYYADDEIFWVKHILIPLSDEQTADLEAYKNAGHSDAQIEAYRRELGMSVKVYKHVDGEEDTSRTYTIQQAYSEIKAVMEAARGNAKDAAEAFERLIYTYNTDPGIFDNERGYAVTATPEDEGGQAESYMIEFAEESRALYNAYRNDMSLDEYKNSDSDDKYEVDDAFVAPAGEVEVGSISVPVLTDYGWHIMFLSVVPEVGKSLGFDSYLTAAEITTAGEAFVEDVSSHRDNYYSNWSSEMANDYFSRDGVIVVHKNVFESYLDDFKEQYEATQEAEQNAAENESGDEHAGHDHA